MDRQRHIETRNKYRQIDVHTKKTDTDRQEVNTERQLRDEWTDTWMDRQRQIKGQKNK